MVHLAEFSPCTVWEHTFIYALLQWEGSDFFHTQWQKLRKSGQDNQDVISLCLIELVYLQKRTRWFPNLRNLFFILILDGWREKKENTLQRNFHTSRQNTGAKVLYKGTFLQLLLMSGFLIKVVIVNIVGKYCSS